MPILQVREQMGSRHLRPYHNSLTLQISHCQVLGNSMHTINLVNKEAFWRKKLSESNLLCQGHLKKKIPNKWKKKTCAFYFNRNFESKNTGINLSLACQNQPAMTGAFPQWPSRKEQAATTQLWRWCFAEPSGHHRHCWTIQLPSSQGMPHKIGFFYFHRVWFPKGAEFLASKTFGNTSIYL